MIDQARRTHRVSHSATESEGRTDEASVKHISTLSGTCVLGSPCHISHIFAELGYAPPQA